MDDCVRVLKWACAECPSESVVFAHRLVSGCVLGRDLLQCLARADKSLLATVMTTTGTVIANINTNRAAKVLEAITLFLQKSLANRLLVGVNREETQIHADSFYLPHFDGHSDAKTGVETDKWLLDSVELLKRKVEVRDRRMGFRSVHGFLRSEAAAVFGEKGTDVLAQLIREQLVVRNDQR